MLEMISFFYFFQIYLDLSRDEMRLNAGSSSLSAPPFIHSLCVKQILEEKLAATVFGIEC